MSWVYHELNLSPVIKFYIREAMVDKVWEIRAVDVSKDRVVIRRWVDEKEEK